MTMASGGDGGNVALIRYTYFFDSAPSERNNEHMKSFHHFWMHLNLLDVRKIKSIRE